MTTEYESELEETRNFSSCEDDEIHVVLKITPVLTFASGSAQESQTGNSELQHPTSLEKVSTQSSHNHKQTNWFSNDDNFGKYELQKRRAKNFKLDGPPQDTEFPVSPESSPTTGRTHKLFSRSLSSSAAATKDRSPSQKKRRLSDPTVPCQKDLDTKSFERQGSLRKLRPYLKRKAVSPLHLLGKVAASTGSKHNNCSHDTNQNKAKEETKGGSKARLAKRLYPSFSKAYEQLSHKERRGSDPLGVPSEDDKCKSVNDYETMINDFSNQIQDLAFNLENLTTSDAKSDFASSGSITKTGRHQGDPGMTENGTEHFFKADDVRLQDMLEEVLRSHLLTMEDYSPRSCDRASRSICKIVTRLCGSSDREKRPGDSGHRKVACLAYIGAVRDGGIQMAAQALWAPDDDIFAAASFRNNSLYGLAVVIATPTF